MTLQKIWDTVGGRSEPVRRKRYAQWNPNRLVYAVWNTVVWAGIKNGTREKSGVGPTCRQESNPSGGSRSAIAVVCIPRVVEVRYRMTIVSNGGTWAYRGRTNAKSERAEKNHLGAGRTGHVVYREHARSEHNLLGDRTLEKTCYRTDHGHRVYATRTTT